MLLFSIVEWSPIILATITGIVTIISLVLQIKLKKVQGEQTEQIKDVHLQINGRMDEMLTMKKQEGKAEQKDEDKKD